MPQLTPEEKYYRTKRYILIGSVVVIVVIALLWWNGCQKGKEAIDSKLAYNLIKDTLQSVLDDTARIYGENRRLRYEANDLDLHIADLVADLQMTKGALIDKSDIADRLAREVKKAKANKDTSTQLEKCDSLADAVFVQRNQINQMLVVDARKDSLHTLKIKNLEAQRDNFERGYDSCKNAVKFASAELPKIEPTGKVYITGGGLLNGPVFGGTGGFTHISKKNRLIAGKAMYTNYGWGGLIELGLPLNFKRK